MGPRHSDLNDGFTGQGSAVRGDIDVELNNLISGAKEEEFQKVLADLEVNGEIDSSEISTKFALIDHLTTMSEAEKLSFRDRVLAGEFSVASTY